MESKLYNILEELYDKYNRREFVNPDPLLFLYDFSEFNDIEVVGLIASSLAYGNVKMILKNVKTVIDTIKKPYDYVLSRSYVEMKNDFKYFKHRFTTGEEIAGLLYSLKKIFKKYGSLYNLFKLQLQHSESLLNCVKIIFGKYFKESATLIPDPEKGSACKRIFLFLRWMIRNDNVDIGIWKGISCSQLIVPLDTHLLKISKILKLTNKKSASINTALEITKNFSRINPEDPVKYDFVLTRFGIRKMGLDFFKTCV